MTDLALVALTVLLYGTAAGLIRLFDRM